MELSKSFPLFENIKSVIADTQLAVVRNINQAMVIAYFQIGRMIVEDEQQGKQRADYAKETLLRLSIALNDEFGRGYSVSNLEYMRSFYVTYRNRISQSATGENNSDENSQSPIGNLEKSFRLSWTHYIQLLKIKNESERSFYEIEAAVNNWSVKELQRQYGSALFERLALSRDKQGVKELAEKGQLIERPADALKSHYVLEFLGLKEDSQYSESDLETAIIDKLEHFMLELGKGFLFEGRQRRFTFEGDSFFVDLVFYNRLLRCFVLLDLKIGKLTHQDIGQMQMYVNYYDRKIKTKEENPTIGVILCKEGNQTVVEFTLPEDNQQIFSKEYKAVLPSKEALKKQLE
ncbi:PDDEXK nuclease domain-containing protein [Mucilaginibacter sp. cycad4]|uniref:PDDEXK nuclease domain-containing protein n=1 Tax=Mucilaginibacter sp. cycad4 TaxID=3342096 RepID=UPI002AAAB60B|nr:PDDEXK nuclease domain-containing protein [Mucilaginibacter gossypii]WPU97529.1 PDDEXK nuclease domain-containing protein [Mucilaginibacter gossypii]